MWTYARLKPKTFSVGRPYRYVCKKYDGRWLGLFKQESGLLAAFGRDTSDHLEMHDMVQHQVWYKMCLDVPARTAICGEIWLPGKPRTDVITALKEGADIEFTPFAVPVYAGKYLDEEPIIVVDEICEPLGLVTGEWYDRPGEWTDAYDPTAYLLEELADFNSKNPTRKSEGFVLKQNNYDQWWKVKPEYTVDAFITDWKPGNNQFFGMIGSVAVSVYDDMDNRVEIANVNGMDWMTRVLMTELQKKNELNGLVIEVEYEQVAAKGRLSQPRFKRWREDKPKRECLLSQLKPEGDVDGV